MRSWINERFENAWFIAETDVVKRGDVQAMQSLFAAYHNTHRFVSDVAYVSPEGAMVAPLLATPGIYVGDRQYFQEAKAGRASLTSLAQGRSSGKPICLFTVPVTRPDGGFGGAVALIVRLESLDQWLLEAKVQPGGGVLLCDGEGRILAPSSAVAAGGGPGEAMAARDVLGAGERGAVLRAGDGPARLAAAVPVGRDGWRLASEVPVSDVLTRYREQTLWLLLAAAATFMMVAPLVRRLSRNLEEPLVSLAGYARTLRATRYRESCPADFPKNAPTEIGELHDAFCQMAGEMRAHIDEVERISVEDALTGLYNRRFLFSGGLKLLEASLRANRPCSCLMLDVDYFKNVNDAFGHAAGDRALAHLARVLARCVRKSDLAARYGGEEFAVLLTGADSGQATALAERIRASLAERPCPVDGIFVPLTCSIGVAEARKRVEYGESALEDMLARADKALYAAKASGRDRVVVDEAGK
ncbi:sensor domain-containing diguanylate cyclase [Solidesulfovibrio sp.]|uniref:sensor domain-containing diguanylate cyclase n=1 Tax=Solidesulfovibrio sp. TaxID=2910990 RepID=UPI002624BBFE|nr:sensor domain-containing diguanylate cyclase [Solidesulfovibrio sp.]